MSNETTLAQLKVPRETPTQQVQAGFFNAQAFDLMQRVSRGLSVSDLVPKQYQGNISNCMIALDMAERMGASPLMVMQSLYVVHGTPSWSAKFLIATVNACGRYSSLRYEWQGEPGSNDYGCRAWAMEKSTSERLDGIWVTWRMVKAEGWDAKNGSKWRTMPDQMFIYRAASFWVRAYAPELSMGLNTVEEEVEILDASRDGSGSYSVNLDELKAQKVDVENGKIMQDTQEAEISQESRKQEQQTEAAQAIRRRNEAAASIDLG